MATLLCKPGQGIRGGDAFFCVRDSQSGIGMLGGWGNAPALIEPRGNLPSAQAQRLLALRRNLVLLETSQSQSIWHKSDLIDAETRLREHAVFVISYMAA